MGTVMVVDDDEDIRIEVKLALKDEGYAVCEAADGVQALEVLAELESRPCLVLLDMMMPRMNGNEFLAAVAKAPRFASMPVVVVSAFPGTVHGGARRVVRKPFDLSELLTVVAEFCVP
jgi:CheY-like chemotaxis protein